MRIGILSYPMLFQRDAAIQLQIRETTRALNALRAHRGVPLQVDMVDPHLMDLETYDLIHVFSASGANYRMVEAAAELGVPIVLSPLIATGWDRACGEHARLADHRLGRQTAWSVQSSYAQTRRALQLASAVVALGQSEKRAIEEGFLIDGAKVRVFPNGVSSHLFDANGELFRQRTGITGPYVMMAGHISPYQNQLGMATVLADMALPFVLLGETRERDQDYLRQVRAVRGVICLGGLKHDARMMASAFAGAAALVLPCHGDACTRTVYDALAAGTPVVMSTASAVELPGSAFALHQVAWDDASAQRQVLASLMAAPPERERVRQLVRPCTWQRAAAQLAACYVDLAGSRSRVPA